MGTVKSKGLGSVPLGFRMPFSGSPDPQGTRIPCVEFEINLRSTLKACPSRPCNNGRHDESLEVCNGNMSRAQRARKTEHAKRNHMIGHPKTAKDFAISPDVTPRDDAVLETYDAKKGKEYVYRVGGQETSSLAPQHQDVLRQMTVRSLEVSRCA